MSFLKVHGLFQLLTRQGHRIGGEINDQGAAMFFFARIMDDGCDNFEQGVSNGCIHGKFKEGLFKIYQVGFSGG